MKELLTNIRYLFRNIFLFRSLLWEYRGYDYRVLLTAMKICIKDMESVQRSETCFVSVNRDKYCDRMKVVSHALQRLLEDEYATTKYFDYEWNSGSIEVLKLKDLPSIKIKWKVEKSQREVDLNIVSQAINKHLTHWWH